MHSHNTVAFEIKWPIKVTIWHHDPGTDGTHDSCGWFLPKLTIEEIRKLNINMDYWKNDVFLIKEWNDSRRLQCIYTTFRIAKWAMYKKHLNLKDKIRILDLALNLGDCLKIYNEYPVSEEIENMIYLVARNMKRLRRKWWQHPRWHIYHWRIQIHFIQRLKRWLFTRCSKCGKRIDWGKTVYSKSWHSEGPQWFRSEKNIICSECMHKQEMF